MDDERTPDFTMPRTMASQLGYYVYLYQDPDSGKPLYVGKGKGQRILAHLSADGDCAKGGAMRALRDAGRKPELRFVRHGLSEDEALLVEAALIDAIGLDKLVNKVAGHGSSGRGSMSFEQLRARFATEPVVVADPVLLIRVSRTFRYDMSATELFEATCGTWKIGPRRDGVRYALAVHDDVVQEVYEIEGWQPGGTHEYETRDVGGVDASRWEFTGHPVTEGPVRERYLHGNVAHLFNRGSQNPIRYASATEASDSEEGALPKAA